MVVLAASSGWLAGQLCVCNPQLFIPLLATMNLLNPLKYYQSSILQYCLSNALSKQQPCSSPVELQPPLARAINNLFCKWLKGPCHEIFDSYCS